MKIKFFRVLSLLLCILLCSPILISCKKKEEDKNTNTASTVTDDGYDFPESIELSDGELNIYNINTYYNAIINLDAKEMKGETVSDAIYTRNRNFESIYNIKVVEELMDFNNNDNNFNVMADNVYKSYAAGEDRYDAVYTSLFRQYSMVQRGLLMDLNELTELRLEEKWWDASLNASCMLNDGKRYVASGSLNLMPYELTWLIFFNKQILTDNKIKDDLFELVRNHQWTLEKMYQIAARAITLDGNSYEFDAGNATVYGIAVHNASPMHFVNGTGITFIREDPERKYVFRCSNSESFSDISYRLSMIFTRSDGTAIGNYYETDHDDGYVPVFNKGKALFLNAELKSGMTLKKVLNTDVNYGVLPMPLATTDQENYIADVSNSTMFLAIPKSNRSPGTSATAIDALTYMSYSQVMPIYYDQYISYRGLNDKDSLEMLNKYIMPGRIIDRGILYNWTNDFVDSYNQAIFNGTSYSNLVAINTKPVNSKIKSFFSGS